MNLSLIKLILCTLINGYYARCLVQYVVLICGMCDGMIVMLMKNSFQIWFPSC